MLSVADALALVTFTKDEERQLAKLEGAVDAILHDRFDGSPTVFMVEEVISLKLAHAIQRKYEERGGWRIQVQIKPNATVFTFTPLFFSLASPSAPPAAKRPQAPEKKALPPISLVSSPLTPLDLSKRLLVRMPTRDRPVQALGVLELYRSKGTYQNKTIEVVIDDNDPTMNNTEVLQRLNALGCVITVGAHRSKIEAVNGGAVKDWDVLLIASDDMVPVATGYDQRVMREMSKHWPHNDGAIFFDDGYQGAALCTLPIMGRRLYDRFGYVYHPDYKSLFSDVEQTELWTAMGRLVYIDEQIIEHRHFVWGHAENDALYQHNDQFQAADQKVYNTRRRLLQPHAQFPFNTPPVWLSLGIATLPSRAERCKRLVDHLYRQTPWLLQANVEIVTDDRTEISIGAKRQAMLERMKGHYVAFIDDDDWVPHDYAQRILGALGLLAPDVDAPAPPFDVVALSGIMTTAGAAPERMEHSIATTEWRTANGVHYRSPNHLNAVRRELALQVGYVDKKHGEDHDYSMRLRPLLKTEADPGPAPLYLYWFDPTKVAGK